MDARPDVQQSGDPAAYESDLVDLGDVKLADLDQLPASVLNTSLRRVLAEVDGAADAVAGFGSGL